MFQLDAKAVMERDLSVIRKKRALREGVKIPMPAPSPIEAPKGVGNEIQESEDLQIDAQNDLPMLDADVIASQLEGTVDENQPHAPPRGGDAMIADQVMPQHAAESAGLAITLPEEPRVDETDVPKIADRTSQDAGAKMEDIMTATNEQDQPAEANAVDFDFESMFNDNEYTATDGTMNFDMNFSNTGPGAGQGQDILVDNAFENLAASGTDLTNVVSTTNEDITGLLDDVLNQAGDATVTGANPATTAPEASKQDEAVSQATSQPAESGTAPSQFDDLFGGTDTFDLGGNDEVIGGGNLADFDFDEEWLKM